MLNRSCLGYDTMERSSNPMHCKSKICEQQIKDLLQLSSNFKSLKGVKDGELDVKSLYGWKSKVSPSQKSKIFEDNISEEAKHFVTKKSEQDLRVPAYVFVLNMRGNPLMPTKPQKARKLLKEGKAKVVKRIPFTIQLLYPTGEARQDIILKVDAGYSFVGISATTDTRELFAEEVELRGNIPRLIEKRRMYRRNRRGRLWHRKPRFLNRTGSKKKGWFAPSIQHKLDTHIRLVDNTKKILPISRTIIEVVSFDTQKMQNPEIEGIEYQQGGLQGYAAREYLLEKWGRKCAYCGKTDIPLEIEHIIPKSRGGSNRISNLTISCHECNQEKGNKTAEEFGHPNIQKKAKKPLKAAAFMNIVRQKLVEILDCESTYGYITKYNRIKAGLEKSHINDAFSLEDGSQHDQKRTGQIFIAKQVRRQNRSLFKANLLKGGRKKRNTVREVNGFRRFDKVLYKSKDGKNKKECFIYGLRKSGYFDVRSINGEKIDASVKSKKLKLLEKAKGIILEVNRQFLPSLTEEVSLPIR
ncbi:MAG: CRISPR-associated endonuclease Cas9 [Candidatus Methanolliviera sp. GoM_oil]|nr:MAG: CRISPR-associated endonuclease Cas9 [Candidatus Methanolliviera sp. GoM_oil]